MKRDVISDNLRNNLKAIRKFNSDTADWIENEHDVNWIEMIEYPDGYTTNTRRLSLNQNLKNLLMHNGSNVETVYVPDKDPREECLKVVNQIKLKKDDVTILMGMGLGYLTKTILNRHRKGHRLIVVEPTAHILRLALGTYNYSKQLLNGDLIIVRNKEEAAYVISAIDTETVVNNWFLMTETYVLKRHNEYAEILKFICDLINQCRCNVGTVMSAGSQIADNDIVNLPYVIRHRGVNELKDIYKSKPVIMVSTGPSLEKNIHLLQDIQDKVIIVAVGQALRILLAYDITPDFICTVDFGETNLGHYKGLLNDAKVPLVCLNRTYAPLLKQYKGPKFIVATPVPGHEHTAAGLLRDKGYIDQGGSVAHLCFGFSYLIGGDPIILIGQDLALGERSHISQADESGTVEIDGDQILWDVKDKRSHLYGQKYGMGQKTYVQGYYGKPVLTNSGLAAFILSFELLAKQYKDRNIINATEGGARIKGIKQMSFNEAINKYCIRKIDKTVIDPYLFVADNSDVLIKKAIELVSKDIENLKNIIKNSEKGLEENKNIWKNRKNEAKMRLAMQENEKYSKEAHSIAKMNALVTLSIFSASRQIMSSDLNVKGKVDHLVKSVRHLRLRLKRNKIILEAAKKASEDLLESYRSTRDLLQKYQETKDESLLSEKENYKYSINDALDYFEQGNWARPLLDARMILKNDINNEEAIDVLQRSLEMREDAIKAAIDSKETDDGLLIKYNELIEQSLELGKKETIKDEKDRDFSKALSILRKAVETLPNKQEARWGLATTLHHMKYYDESIKVYKKLVEDFPDVLQYKFELGQVLIISGQIKEGICIIKEVMEGTEKFDSFLRRIGQLYTEAGLHDQALSAFNNYLNKFPYDYSVLVDKGNLLKKMGRNKEAEEAINRALLINPNLNIEYEK